MHLTAILATALSSRHMHCNLLTCRCSSWFEFSIIELLPVHLPRPTSSKRPARLMIVCFLRIWHANADLELLGQLCLSARYNNADQPSLGAYAAC